MSRTDDFFSSSASVSLNAPTTRSMSFPSCPAPAASTSKTPYGHQPKPSLEERLLKAVEELAKASEEDGREQDEWESMSSSDSAEASGEEELECYTPQDSPLARSPTFFPKHASFELPLKPALKSASMSRTSSGSSSSVSFQEGTTLWHTYSSCSYSRRGPAPVKKLSMEQLVEMQTLGCLPWNCVWRPNSLDHSPIESPPPVSRFDSSSEEDSAAGSD